MMRLINIQVFVLTIGFSLFAVTALAQIHTQVGAAEVDPLFEQWDMKGSPGCAVGVFHEGEIIYQNGYGEADLDHGIPITTESVFYIGSVSKQFAAAAIAILADMGKISLDDEINDYIPEMPEYNEPIRIRHLVHHTSGIYDLYSTLALAGVNVEDVLTLEDKVGLISSQSRLNFTPGSEYLYSNSGYTLINRIVESASDLTLREFTDKYLFEPLGMENTHFHDDRTMVVPNRALSYQRKDKGFRMSYISNFEGVGPGGLYTTVGDMLKWNQNFYDNRLDEAPNFYEIMHTPGVLADGDTLDYAFALNLDEHKGQKRIGHGGSFMGFRADYRRFPEHHFSTVVLCNLGDINPADLTRQIADLYLEEVYSEYLEEYAGVYHNADMDVNYEIGIKNGNLYLDRELSPSGELSYVEKDEFRTGGWSFEFTRSGGVVDGFKVSSGRARNVMFEKR